MAELNAAGATLLSGTTAYGLYDHNLTGLNQRHADGLGGEGAAGGAESGAAGQSGARSARVAEQATPSDRGGRRPGRAVVERLICHRSPYGLVVIEGVGEW